jgi:deoxyhypusine synthase
MVEDPDCKVVLTLSGAMTIAKMGKVIQKMIDADMVQAVVSTGALMAHGLSEAVGMTHYRHDPRMSDEELFERGYNRVYDTLEMEANLNYVEEFSARALDRLGHEQELSSEIVCRALGQVLAEDPNGQGVLRSAYAKGVPVYVPAFTDSELGLDLSTWAMKRAQAQGVTDPAQLLTRAPRYNPFLDLQSFARFCLDAKRLGIFTIGGGVPRNWAQEVGPYVDITNHRLGLSLTPPRYRYAVRICPEPTHWGGLSGCTYSEGVSWGKFVPPSEGGRFAEVFADATTVWPLLVKATLEELG